MNKLTSDTLASEYPGREGDRIISANQLPFTPLKENQQYSLLLTLSHFLFYQEGKCIYKCRGPYNRRVYVCVVKGFSNKEESH